VDHWLRWVGARERLSAQLAEFEQAIVRHEAAAKQAARDGDDAELDRAEIALRAAQDRTKSLKAALADVAQELEALERNKAEIADRKLRAETVAEIELVVRNMIEASTEFDAAAARLSEYTTRAVPWCSGKSAVLMNLSPSRAPKCRRLSIWSARCFERTPML
jgi:chromosome segregation ATPase